jgi:DNA-binding XRE family transcriptional regulator/predicted RNase H-like HicB family nuclease
MRSSLRGVPATARNRLPYLEVERLTEYVAVLAREGTRTLIEFPDCPGCQTFAESSESVAEVARDALEGWLYSHLVDGEAPPRPAAEARGSRTRAIRVSPQLALALQIRWRRQDLDLSQSQLGRRLGVTRQQVATLENPDSNWRISTLLRVAEALGLELDVALVTRGATDAPLTAAR